MNADVKDGRKSFRSTDFCLEKTLGATHDQSASTHASSDTLNKFQVWSGTHILFPILFRPFYKKIIMDLAAKQPTNLHFEPVCCHVGSLDLGYSVCTFLPLRTFFVMMSFLLPGGEGEGWEE